MLVAAAAGSSCNGTTSVDAELAGYRSLAGRLASAETSAVAPRGRYVAMRVRLEATSGLGATGWLVRPRSTGCFPAVLLQDGREENANVVGRLPADYGDVVVLSLDYPSALPYEIHLANFLFHSDSLRAEARRIPAAFLLGAAFLASRPDVDTARIAVAATSFAVPFAAIAAAADPRFHDVALIYGAGDLAAVLAANLGGVPRPLRRPAAAVAMHPFADFAPERFIGRIAPRPLVMVNGIDDPQMPATAVRRLFDAARSPKTQIWLHTGHLMPTDSALIRALIDTAFDTMPVLSAAAAPGACAHSALR